jgi:hypothetical protein
MKFFSFTLLGFALLFTVSHNRAAADTFCSAWNSSTFIEDSVPGFCHSVTHGSRTCTTTIGNSNSIVSSNDESTIFETGPDFACNVGTKQNICDRGAIGDSIAFAVHADSCEKVSTSAMANLTTLALYQYEKYPNIVSLPAKALLGLDNLKVLDLSQLYYLSEIPEGSLSALPHLESLKLGQAFKTIKKGEFANLRQLVTFEMAPTYLDTIEAGAFEGDLNLVTINLWGDGSSDSSHKDSLQVIQNGSFSRLPSLTKIDLGYLPGGSPTVLSLTRLDAGVADNVEVDCELNDVGSIVPTSSLCYQLPRTACAGFYCPYRGWR